MSDRYPDLNNHEYASQWRQDWFGNSGDVDTSGGADGELYVLQKGKGAKGKGGIFNSICYNCGKSGHSTKFCCGKRWKGKRKRTRQKRETAKVGMSKCWTVGKGWSDGKGWNSSGKGWEQQRPAGMNNLERDSKQKKYDVLVMEVSTHEKIVRDSDWCVPVKYVAKLNRMRGQTPTKTNINFFVDPEEESRDNDATTDRLGTNQSDLEGSANCKCSCCEVDDTQRQQMRGLPCKKFKCMCLQLEGCRYQFL